MRWLQVKWYRGNSMSKDTEAENTIVFGTTRIALMEQNVTGSLDGGK